MESSSTINDILPLHILLEILYELPVKELHRNKTVCKFWSSIISHPSFGSQYSIRRNSSSSSYYTLYLHFHHHCSNSNNEEEGWSIDSPRVSLNFLHTGSESDLIDKYYRYRVLASSNGPLLCSIMYDPSQVTYYVVNPLTKQSLTLPSPPTTSNELEVLSGIACCESSNQTEFKVVRIVRDAYYRVSNILDIEIFESTTKQWKVLTTQLDSKVSLHTVNAVYHRGILYWSIERRDSVVAFDPYHDLCLLISLPESYVKGSWFGVSQDHLYYARIDFRALPNIPCTIWRCDKFDGEYTWSVHRSLDLEWIIQKQIIKDYRICTVSAMDPMDYNILYLSTLHRSYSLDVARREMTELHPVGAFQCVVFVEPTWPTSLPRLPVLP